MSDASEQRYRAPPERHPPAGLDAAIDQPPQSHRVDANIGAARAEEHAAPAPTTRVGGKVWAIAGLLVVVGIAAALA